MDPAILQSAISAILSAAFIGGLFTMFTKKLWSPESKNDLAKIGNDFAAQLLKDAKSEREELRLSIHELEQSNATRQETINRLQTLLFDKDRTIRDLEDRQINIAKKLARGEAISLQDIFGHNAPPDFALIPLQPMI